MKKRRSLFVIAATAVLILGGCAATTGTASRTNTNPVYTSSDQPGVIPAGTTLSVRLNETIDSSQPIEGRTFSGEVVREIVDSSGTALVPQGSPAQVYVYDFEKGGTLDASRAKMGVLEENRRSEGGLGANRRTAEMVGGGAALGAIIGAVAGGGSGAAIGAAVGAGGGAAAQVITRDKQIRIPAETVMNFQLENPIRLVGYSR
ncbi:MAG: hypothetical protein KJZ78_07350 [Bryobacteraceae bacterium]|nr:hypothetical protein [Bryobacteraceae bacterium]